MPRPKLRLRKKGKPRGPVGAPQLRPYHFKKGQKSANPEGGRISHRPVLISEALKLGLAGDGSEDKLLSKAEEIADSLLARAVDDNFAVSIILDRTEGRAPQHIDADIAVSGKLEVEHDAAAVIKKLLRED